MPTFQYKKLVRDNIRKFHEDKGHYVTGTTLSGANLRQALCDKLHEEADEVNGALSRDELIEEIADVRQILDDLSVIEAITEADLQQVKTKKLERKGGFQSGSYIETVAMPEDDEWVEYCRKNPEKYPEIKEN